MIWFTEWPLSHMPDRQTGATGKEDKTRIQQNGYRPLPPPRPSDLSLVVVALIGSNLSSPTVDLPNGVLLLNGVESTHLLSALA